MDQNEHQPQEAAIFYDEDDEPIRRIVGRNAVYLTKQLRPAPRNEAASVKPIMNKTGGLAGGDAAETAVCTFGDVPTRLVPFGLRHPEIVRLELFGSVARGEATAKSDVDLVVDFADPWKEDIDAFVYFGHLDDLERDLAVVLGRPAHLTDRAGVESSVRIGNTALARAIARDGQIVYEAD